MSCWGREYKILQRKVIGRKNISAVQWREARSCLITIGSRVGLQKVPYCSLPFLISSFALSLFSCFVFTVEYTWCCLNIAWVCIDFSSRCSVGGCLTQEFRNSQGFLEALCTFPLRSSLSIHHKNALSLCAAHLTWCPLNVASLASQSGAHGACVTFHKSSMMHWNLSQSLLNGEENILVIDSRAPWKSMYIKQFENVEIQQTNGV